MWKPTSKEYEKFCVARSDSGGYDPSGYAALVDGQKAVLLYICHCSCHGTFGYESGEMDGCSVNWEGSLDQLMEMAKKRIDPDMSGRPVAELDYGVNHLLEVYTQLITKFEGSSCVSVST